MDFWKTLVVLVRRWYVAIPALAVSLGLAAFAYESVPSKYEATGSIVLLSPSGGASTNSDTGQTNPLLSFDGSLTTVSTAITQVLLSPAVTEELSRQGATAGFEVGNGNLDGPFINVVADGRSPTEAQRTVRLVLQRARTELQNRETAYKAPPSTYIQVDDLVRPTEAKELKGGRVRAAGAALALGLAASLSAAFMIESMSENRRERRQRGGRHGSPPPSSDDRGRPGGTGPDGAGDLTGGAVGTVRTVGISGATETAGTAGTAEAAGTGAVGAAGAAHTGDLSALLARRHRGHAQG